MKKTGKILALMLAAAMAVAMLASCGDGGKTPAGTTAKTPADSVTDKAPAGTTAGVETDEVTETEPEVTTAPKVDYGQSGLRPLPKNQHVDAYTSGTHQEHHNLAATGEVWGILANLSGTFEALNLYCSSYDNNLGTITVKVYGFDKDYDTTVAGEPLASKDLVDFPDNKWQAFEWDTPLPAGEYLVLISGSHGEHTAEEDYGVAIWDLESSPFIRTFKDGEEVDTGVWAQFFIGD
ncbi:MAG: hypothetical protein IJU75_06045 [Clostridia bacterium]|nr:hypothetical protein [Clostridia bacterium]MBQ9880156.1 hypothetical protein [Clostridia bacterium]